MIYVNKYYSNSTVKLSSNFTVYDKTILIYLKLRLILYRTQKLYISDK